MYIQTGTVITGKELKRKPKGKVLCKILCEDLKIDGFLYKLGMNDVDSSVIRDTCQTGLHFTNIDHIFDFFSDGTKLAIIDIPDEEPVYVDDNKFWSRKLVIEQIMDLRTVEAWQYLVENKINLNYDCSFAIRWAAKNGCLEVIQYLHKHGVDITILGNTPVQLATKNGHLDIVQYLYQNGVDMFEIGDTITGKELKYKVLGKILSEDLNMQGFQYKIGMNEDIQSLTIADSCEAGLDFAEIKYIGNFLDYGTKLAIIRVPDEELVYVDNGKFRSHRLVIEKVLDLWTIETWKYLAENGINSPIALAAKYGNLDIIKYLHENGYDIIGSDDNYALKIAIAKGHLDTVKYLDKNGADIMFWDRWPIYDAIEHRYRDVVNYVESRQFEMQMRKSKEQQDQIAIRKKI